MKLNTVLLWQILNILVIICLGYLIFKAHKKKVQREEAIVSRLDELIRINKSIEDHLYK